MPLPIEVISFFLIGAFTGLASGLFGVGGGIIVVPCLAFMFSYLSQIPTTQIMHMAIGTSLSVMIITAIAATYSRHKCGDVKWRLVLGFTPGIVLGVIGGGLLANVLPTRGLEIIFGIILVLVAIKMVFFSKVVTVEKQLPKFIWVVFSLLVGIAAGLLGIGGAVLIIPFLAYCGVLMNNASGTSSAITLPIAIVGAITFMLTGSFHGIPVPNSTGFIYWPATIGVAIGSAAFAPLGVAIAVRMNTRVLKKAFAVVMLFVAVKLLA